MPLRDCLTKSGFSQAEVKDLLGRLKDFRVKGENNETAMLRMLDEVLEPELLGMFESMREQLELNTQPKPKPKPKAKAEPKPKPTPPPKKETKPTKSASDTVVEEQKKKTPAVVGKSPAAAVKPAPKKAAPTKKAETPVPAEYKRGEYTRLSRIAQNARKRYESGKSSKNKASMDRTQAELDAYVNNVLKKADPATLTKAEQAVVVPKRKKDTLPKDDGSILSKIRREEAMKKNLRKAEKASKPKKTTTTKKKAAPKERTVDPRSEQYLSTWQKKEKVDPDGVTSGFSVRVDGIEFFVGKNDEGKWSLAPNLPSFDSAFELRQAIEFNENNFLDKLKKNAKSITEFRAKERAKAKEAAAKVKEEQELQAADEAAFNERFKTPEQRNKEAKAKAKKKTVKRKKTTEEKTEQEINDEAKQDIVEEQMESIELDETRFSELAEKVAAQTATAEEIREFNEMSSMYHDQFPLGEMEFSFVNNDFIPVPLTDTQLSKIKRDFNKLSRFLRRIVPDLKIMVHPSGIQMVRNNLAEEGWNLRLALDINRDEIFRQVRSSAMYNPRTKTIHINGALFADNLVFHEAAHPLMDFVFQSRPDLKATFYNELVALSKQFTEIEQYIAFGLGRSYTNDKTKPTAKSMEETIVEFMADVLMGDINPADFGSVSTLEKIKNKIISLINSVLRDFGITEIKVSDKNILNFAESIRQAYNDGQTLRANPTFYERTSNLNFNEAVEKLQSELGDFKVNFGEIVLEANDITDSGAKVASREDIAKAVDRINNEAPKKDYIDGDIKFSSHSAKQAKMAQKILNSAYTDPIKIKLLQNLGFSFKDAKDLVTGKTTLTNNKKGKKGKKTGSTKKAAPKVTTPNIHTNVTPDTWSKLTQKEKVQVNRIMQNFGRRTDTSKIKQQKIDDVQVAFDKFKTLLGKIMPNLKLNFHDNVATYRLSVLNTGRSENTNKFTAGFYDPSTQTIHINGPIMTKNTIFHEGAHPLMDIVFNVAPELRDSFYTDLVRLARLNPEIDKYIQFGLQVDPKASELESIVEFMADVLSGKLKPKNIRTSTIQRLKQNIKDAILNLFNKFGIPIKSLTNNSLVAFAENIKAAYETGVELQGNPSMATNGIVSFQQPNIVKKILQNASLSDNVKVAILESLGYPTADARAMVQNWNKRRMQPNVSKRPNARGQIDLEGIVEDAAEQHQENMAGRKKKVTIKRINAKGEEVEVTKTVREKGMTKDQSLQNVVTEFYDPLTMAPLSPDGFKTRVEARHAQNINDLEAALNDSEAYFDLNENMFAKFWRMFKRWVRKEFTSSGAMTQDQFKHVEEKRGLLQAHLKKSKQHLKLFHIVTRGLSKADRLAVNEILQGGSLDLLSDAVGQQQRENIGGIVTVMRAHIDGLTTDMRKLGLFEDPYIQTIFDLNEGTYINRIYMRNLRKNMSKRDVPKDVWNAAKRVYRNEMVEALRDGRVNDKRKGEILEILKDDARLEEFMNGILDKSEEPVFKIGGMQGSKDTSILKERRDIPKVIREFYGEVTEAELNYVNTVTKLSNYVANTRMLQMLEIAGAMSGSNKFISYTEKSSKDWVKVNASNSESLTPLTSPIWIRKDVHDTLAIQLRDLPRWVNALLVMNGVVKGFKTVLSPVTQVRNFVSANTWMWANGYILDGIIDPSGTAKNNAALQAVKILSEASKGKEQLQNWLKLKDFSKAAVDPNLTELDKAYIRMAELQIVDQNVVANELVNDYLKDVDKQGLVGYFTNPYGTNFWGMKKGKGAKAPRIVNDMRTAPRRIYAATDDFFRVTAYLVERKRYANILYNDTFENLNDIQKRIVEEEAASIVRNVYPNYSKIYPIVDKIRKIPLIGAFVSFSAEMIRTTRNQLVQAALEVSNRKIEDGKWVTLPEPNTKRQMVGIRRMVGVSTMLAATFTVTEFLKMLLDFDDEEVDDLIALRPPWQEVIAPVDNLGNGKYVVMNPSTLNPYGYFADIFAAIINESKAGGNPLESAWAGVWKLLEPFVGPEIALDIIKEEWIKAVQETNADTDAEKFAKATMEVLNNFMPGFVTQIQRFYPDVTEEELRKNPNLINELRQKELYAIGGVRLTEIDVMKAFNFNKGPEILKKKKRATRDFWRQKYKDSSKLKEQYNESAREYREYLDEAREMYMLMIRRGVNYREARAAFGDGKGKRGPDFDGTRFSAAERKYIFGQTSRKPKLIFKDYND